MNDQAPFQLPTNLTSTIKKAEETEATLKASKPNSPTRLELMTRLNQSLPRNELGLPEIIYRADLIPDDFYSLLPYDQNTTLKEAAVQVSYDEGFPTLDGAFFWDKLPFESEEYFSLFLDYKKTGDELGYHSIKVLLDYLYPIKRFQEERRQKELTTIRELYTYYYWGARVKAYELVGYAAYTKRRERRAIQSEDWHYLEIDKMLRTLMLKWGEFTSPENQQAFFSEMAMAPDKFVKTFKELVLLHRLSAGLSTTGPLPESKTPADALMSLEGRMRVAARRNQEDTGSESQKESLDRLLADPKSMEMAQTLLLKIMTPEAQGINPNAAEPEAEAEAMPVSDGPPQNVTGQ